MSSILRKFNPKAKRGKVTLTYFKIRGTTLPIRLMLEWLEIPYEMNYYYIGEGPEFDQSQWFTDKPKLGIDFANLPFYVDGDLKMAESFAILRHVARSNKFFYPQNDAEERACDVAQGATLDFRTSVIGVAYSSNFEEAKHNYLANLQSTLGNFERVLAKHQYLTGHRMMYVDFVFADVLDWLELMEPGCLNVLPCVRKYYEDFENLGPVAKFKNSDKHYQFPVMNRKAAWGGQPVL